MLGGLPRRCLGPRRAGSLLSLGLLSPLFTIATQRMQRAIANLIVLEKSSEATKGEHDRHMQSFEIRGKGHGNLSHVGPIRASGA